MYSSWAQWLEAFAAGEDQDDSALAPLELEVGPDVIRRFALRCEAALNTRLQAWVDGLSADLRRSTDPAAVTEALVRARRRVAPIVRFANSPLLPEDLRPALSEHVDKTIASAQESLERSAGLDIRTRETFLRVVRSSPLTLPTEAAPAPSTVESVPRRVILTALPEDTDG